MASRCCLSYLVVVTLLLSVVVHFPQTWSMSVEQALINKLDTKQSFMLVDGLELKVPTAYERNQVVGVKGFERGLTITFSPKRNIPQEF